VNIEPITAARLRELLHYDPSTGVFTWLPRSIMIDQRNYTAHRLAWLYTTGEWPERELDHRNGNRVDNRMSNLRPAARKENARNTGKRAGTSSKFKGVSWNRRLGKWEGYVGGGINGKRKTHLGFFDDPQDAALAYATVACGLYGEFANPHWRDLLGRMRGVSCT
jgi:hypothetical protein